MPYRPKTDHGVPGCRTLRDVAVVHNLEYGTIVARYRRGDRGGRLIRSLSGPKSVDPEIYGLESLSAAARAYGISVYTIASRYERGLRGVELVEDPAQNGKPIVFCGRTFKQWSDYWKKRGLAVSARAVQAIYFEYRKTEPERRILAIMLDRYNGRIEGFKRAT